MSVGIAEIEARILALTDRLCAGLREKGYRVHSPRGPSEKSGIVTFSHERHDAGDLLRRLREHRIVGALRDGKVRLSPHFYNTEAEIDRVIEILPS